MQASTPGIRARRRAGSACAWAELQPSVALLRRRSLWPNHPRSITTRHTLPLGRKLQPIATPPEGRWTHLGRRSKILGMPLGTSRLHNHPSASQNQSLGSGRSSRLRKALSKLRDLKQNSPRLRDHLRRGPLRGSQHHRQSLQRLSPGLRRRSLRLSHDLLRRFCPSELVSTGRSRHKLPSRLLKPQWMGRQTK